jgi:hypothetical protein
MTMQASEQLFLQTVGRFIGNRFKTWTAPLIERIEKIESTITAPPVEFTAAQTKVIEQMIAAAVEQAIIVGKIANIADVDAAIAKIPEGKPGRDGTDGVNGIDGKSVTASDLVDVVRGAVDDAVAKLPVSPHVVGGYIDLCGDLYFSNSDGSAFKAGHVVGKDADPAFIDAQIKAASEKFPPPKDGKDGFSLDNFTAVFDGERTLTLRFEDAAHSKEVAIVLAVPLFRGVWSENEYQRGDMVIRDGSLFVALKDTVTVPGTANSNWQLATKRGRDGKDGKQGPPGPRGENGRDGRDMTQLGPDGRKWG